MSTGDAKLVAGLEDGEFGEVEGSITLAEWVAHLEKHPPWFCWHSSPTSDSEIDTIEIMFPLIDVVMGPSWSISLRDIVSDIVDDWPPGGGAGPPGYAERARGMVVLLRDFASQIEAALDAALAE